MTGRDFYDAANLIEKYYTSVFVHLTEVDKFGDEMANTMIRKVRDALCYIGDEIDREEGERLEAECIEERHKDAQLEYRRDA